MFTIPFLGSATAAATLPGTLELMALTAGGFLPAGKRRSSPAILRKLAVVIPAHNEEQGIAECLKSIMTAEKPSAACQVTVVADNCTDKTEAIARELGATVWVRSDSEKRGKGFVLEYAFEKLLSDPETDAVLVVDADTVVAPNFLTACEACFSAGAEAVQCRYLVKNPGDSERARLMNTALLAFNVLRPRARARLGLSVGILGNGWGVSRRCLERLPYNAHSVVEDLEYHIRLVREGLRVHFIDETTVYGEMPADSRAASTQRERWEGGRLRMIREQIPMLLKEIATGKLRLLEPAGELLLLPLAYHVGGLLVALVIPFPPTQLYALTGLGVVAAHVLVGIAIGGGTKEDVKALLGAPKYIVWKAGFIKRILAASRADHDWIRTART
jgi:cellulose synthase/poly-beta-1,6-N-acetylglucosamine synthase-like glycosyltransferase